MAYIVMDYVAMAYIVMSHVVIAYVVMACAASETLRLSDMHSLGQVHRPMDHAGPTMVKAGRPEQSTLHRQATITAGLLLLLSLRVDREGSCLPTNPPAMVGRRESARTRTRTRIHRFLGTVWYGRLL